MPIRGSALFFLVAVILFIVDALLNRSIVSAGLAFLAAGHLVA